MQIRASVASILIGIAAACGCSAQAQTFSDGNLTVSLGAVENLSDGQGRYAPYAEIEVYSSLYRAEEAGITFGAGLYVAGWMDGAAQTSGCRDCITYSYSSTIGGLRGAAQLDHFPLPLSFWGGVAHHVIWADYESGAGVAGDIGRDHRKGYSALEAGLQFRIPLSARIHLEPKAHVHLPLPVSSRNHHVARFAGSAGISYSL